MVDAKTELENIQGYRAINILVDGVSEEVRIKKFNVYELQTYATVYGDQGKSVELFCGKPDKWAASISYEDVERILDIGVEINDPILNRYADRDGSILKRMLAVQERQTEKLEILKSLTAASVSRSPSLPAQMSSPSPNGPLAGSSALTP
jgi:hypothetical protein